MTTRTPAAAPAPLNLALAVIGSSNAPLLLLDGDLTIVAASASFCSAFAIGPETVVGVRLTDIGDGEWGLRQLASLLAATASGMAEVGGYEMELKRDGQPPRHLIINARKLDYGDEAETRLLLAVSDVTDARSAEKLKDDLLREKAILLQEVQHRVANSLQIIASVLLQNARKVQSEETRAHLTEAHQRVMSVAAVQQQLAASRLGSVALGPYFTQLCQSLGASMIHDPEQISLDVTADDSSVNADISVSLGLIITELVINALKHAFPGRRKGLIRVDYQAHGPNWTLSVNDNGVGMPKGADVRPGLGTSIVEALANQLNARVQVANASPGTAVSIIHTQLAAVASTPRADKAV